MAKKKTAKKAKAVADFKKKKKKVGKIQRAEDTKLQITTRKINVPTQHNEKNGSLLYKGKSFTELLAGTRHTNSNVRVTNITNLRDHLHSSVEQITSNLGQLVSRCGSLISDTEARVRGANTALIQLLLQSCTDTDLEPFVKVLIAQLSSSMLHIDKGVQGSTVEVITALLTTHPKLVHSSTCSLIPSLTVLLSTLKNKGTITSYLGVVCLLLAYVTKQCNRTQTKGQVKCVKAAPFVSLRTCRTLCSPSSSSSSSPSMNLTAVAELVSVTVGHVERLWMEDVPPKVLLNVEPALMSTALLLVDLLILFTRLDIVKEKACLVKLHEISKSVSGRYPFQCSGKGRTSVLVWRLNILISKYLLLIDRVEQVEEYFTHLLNNSSKLSSTEIEECLEVLTVLPSPGSQLLDTLVNSSVQQSANSVLFCTHFIQHYLDKIPEEQMGLILQSLDRSLDKVAMHLIQYFHSNRNHVVTSVVVKCLAPPVFNKLQPQHQAQLLELCYSGLKQDPAGLCVKSLAKAGQCIVEQCVSDKFYSVIQAMLYSGHLSTGQYISLCLSQVHGQHPSPSSILSSLTLLPAKPYLLHLTLPTLVQQLYHGLAHTTLAAILRLVIVFCQWSAERSELCTAESQGICPAETVLKFSKIIFSLIFNGGSGSAEENTLCKSIVLLAVRVSMLHPPTLHYVISMLSGVGKKVQGWYFGLMLERCVRREDVGRGDVVKCYHVVRDVLSDTERRDADYQIRLMRTAVL